MPKNQKNFEKLPHKLGAWIYFVQNAHIKRGTEVVLC